MMFRRTLTRVAVPAVVVAAFLTAGPAWAQYAGRGGRGGGSYGGGSYGGDPTSAGAPSGGGSTGALEIIFRASGVPNRNGQISWPFAFRVLRADALVQQVDAELQVAGEQVTAGGANPLLLADIRLNVETLRQALLAHKENRRSLPRVDYEDAERFLQKLQKAPQILAGLAPAGPPEAKSR
jgi:hypothetical protein